MVGIRATRWPAAFQARTSARRSATVRTIFGVGWDTANSCLEQALAYDGTTPGVHLRQWVHRQGAAD
jgi:hypothetical protein